MGNFCPRIPKFVTGRAASRELNQQDGRLKVVQYYSPGCGHCNATAPEIVKLQQQYCGEIDVLKVNVDTDGTMADEAKVKHLPTVAVYRNGQQIARTVGAANVEHFAGLVERAMKKVAKEKK